MNNLRLKCRIIFIVLLGLVVFTTCFGEKDSIGNGNKFINIEPQLNSEIEMQIKQDYLEAHAKDYFAGATIDTIEISPYYGTFNGSVVVMMWVGYALYTDAPETRWEANVAGILFRNVWQNSILVWNGGKFYELQEAYDLGLLSQEDLKIIGNMQRRRYPSLYIEKPEPQEPEYNEEDVYRIGDNLPKPGIRDVKIYWDGDLSGKFIYDRVQVNLKLEYSQNKREVKLKDFGIDHEKIGLGVITDNFCFENLETALIQWENYRQLLTIEIKEKFRSQDGVVQAIRELEKSPIVRYVGPQYICKEELYSVVNDEYFDEQWWLEQIDIESAWNIAMGSGMTIGISEAGRLVDYHSDLSPIPISLRMFHAGDISRHKTMVAGVIAAIANNNIGVAGIAPQASLACLSGLDLGDGTRTINFAAANNIRIINCSNNMGGRYNQGVSDAIATFDGIITCSASNYGENIDILSGIVGYGYPARYSQSPNKAVSSKIISVGASNRNDTRAFFPSLIEPSSGWGKRGVCLYAPGVDIISTWPESMCDNQTCTNNTSTHVSRGYHSWSGTSFSAPITAGVISLLWEAYPNMTPAEIKTRILESVDVIAELAHCPILGEQLAVGLQAQPEMLCMQIYQIFPWEI